VIGDDGSLPNTHWRPRHVGITYSRLGIKVISTMQALEKTVDG